MNEPSCKNMAYSDCLYPRKSWNRIDLDSEPLFKILVKHCICYLMSAFHEKIIIEPHLSCIIAKNDLSS